LVENREWALELLQNFNKKTAELLLNGNDIDTGLVKLSPRITALVYKNSVDSNSYDIGVSFSKGVELNNAISNTDIEVTMNSEEQSEDIENNNNETFSRTTDANYVPPCGHAFRNWIFQS
jgi:hypothetical protein